MFNYSKDALYQDMHGIAFNFLLLISLFLTVVLLPSTEFYIIFFFIKSAYILKVDLYLIFSKITLYL